MPCGRATCRPTPTRAPPRSPCVAGPRPVPPYRADRGRGTLSCHTYGGRDPCTGPAASSHAMRSHARQQQVGSEPGAVACGPSQHSRTRPGVAAEADDRAPSVPCHTCGSTAHSRASCPNLDKACSLRGTVSHLRSACHRSTAAARARPRGMDGSDGPRAEPRRASRDASVSRGPHPSTSGRDPPMWTGRDRSCPLDVDATAAGPPGGHDHDAACERPCDEGSVGSTSGRDLGSTSGRDLGSTSGRDLGSTSGRDVAPRPQRSGRAEPPLPAGITQVQRTGGAIRLLPSSLYLCVTCSIFFCRMHSFGSSSWTSETSRGNSLASSVGP